MSPAIESQALLSRELCHEPSFMPHHARLLNWFKYICVYLALNSSNENQAVLGVANRFFDPRNELKTIAVSRNT
jgi:hypothetical protein